MKLKLVLIINQAQDETRVLHVWASFIKINFIFIIGVFERYFPDLSIREVEVIISVSIIFSLSEESSNSVKSSWDPNHSQPDSAAEINNKSLEGESTNSSVKEMEEPLLGSIWSMMPNITSGKSTLLIEILFSIPCSILHLWNSKTLTIGKSHIFHVAMAVMGKSTSYNMKKINCFVLNEIKLTNYSFLKWLTYRMSFGQLVTF